MSEGFVVFGLMYIIFSMLFSMWWIDSILHDRSFINYYRNSIKNKNAFGKVYVTIFYLFALPSYLFSVICFCIFLVLQWIYDLGVKIDNEIEEDSNV